MEAKAVLDTNVVVSKHLSKSNDSPARKILRQWRNREFDLLYQADILAEYIEVLLLHGVDASIIRRLISIILTDGQRVKVRFFHLPTYPSDPDDIPFLLCALNGKASHLVSYDDHLLSLGDAFAPLSICRPKRFLEDLQP